MNERIKQIRTALNISSRDFASKLEMSNSAISLIESGKRNITSRLITSICREFKVNEDWLRTGEGEMFQQTTREEKIAELVLNLARGPEDAITFKMAKILPKLNDEQLKALYNIAVLLENNNLPD